MKKSSIFVFIFTFVVVMCALGLRHQYINLSQKYFGNATAKVRTLTENISSFFKKSPITEENEQLKTKLAQVASYEEENKLIKKENETLRELLVLKKTLPYKNKTAANVVDIQTLGDFLITVDRGKLHGIKPDDIAIWGNTLVGKVSEVFDKISYITPISAPDAIVGIINENQDVGMLAGTPSLYKKNMCEVSFFSNTAKILNNTTVFTSGMSDVYPPGIVIGKILTQNGKTFVKTEVDFFKIRTLLLISPG